MLAHSRKRRRRRRRRFRRREIEQVITPHCLIWQSAVSPCGCKPARSKAPAMIFLACAAYVSTIAYNLPRGIVLINHLGWGGLRTEIVYFVLNLPHFLQLFS